MRALQYGSYRNIIHHSYNHLYRNPYLLYNPSIYSFASQTQATLPGYEKPLPLDVKTGKLRRNFNEEQKTGLRKRNYRFRKYLTNQRRHMARELLFGNAATRMMNKLAKGANQKRLQKELINHLYALKLNSFRLPFMEVESDVVPEDGPKKSFRLTRRLKSGSSWNIRAKKRKTVSWADTLRRTTKNNRIK